MIIQKIAVDLPVDSSRIIEQASKAYPNIEWVEADTSDADLIVSTSSVPNVRGTVLILEDGDSYSDFLPVLASAIGDGRVYIPTTQSAQVLRSRLAKEVKAVRNLRDNNPLIPPAEEHLPEQLCSGSHPLMAFLVHGTAMASKLPELERKLSARAYRSLQRKVPGYKPMSPVGCPQTNEAYLRTPKSGSDLRARIEKVKDKIDRLGVKLGLSTLDYSQLNLGIFAPGGLHRTNNGLLPPDEELSTWMMWSAEFMLRGMRHAYESMSEDEFAQISTRAGVKVDNYQGPYLNTTDHGVRQASWVMKIEDGGPFSSTWLPALSCSGLRTQPDANGKRRPSFVPGDDNTVLFTRAVDGDDLSGIPVAEYSDLSASRPEFFVDDGEIGGRKRIVANVSSYLNDDLLPIPSFIADFKDGVYKSVYQQDLSIMSRFVSGSPEFIAFWREGYKTNSFLRERVRALFSINDEESFLDYVTKTGERVSCGDVVQYDASATWEFILPFATAFLSPEALTHTERNYNSDKIGVYCDHRGVKRFYYIMCDEDPSYPKWKNELIRQTRRDMSSLPSGLALTSIFGRGPMLAVLLHLLVRCCVDLGLEKEEVTKAIKDSVPSFGSETTFSLVAAWLNDGGDDHNLGLLILHLLTGKSLDECEVVLERHFTAYEFLSLLPEYPKTNCGFRFHDDENKRCIAVSLAPERMWSNNCYPEYPKSFTGLLSSIDLYVGSAVGSPVEDQMLKLAEVLIEDVIGLSGYEELVSLALEEDHYFQTSETNLPARQRIAMFLGVNENDLEYEYPLQELYDLGVPEEWILSFRKPLPPELSTNPFIFFNSQTIKQNVNKKD